MEVGGLTKELVSLALDAALAQHRAISQNIANANVTGYKRNFVNFEELFNSVESARDADAIRTEVTGAKQRLNSGVVIQSSDQKVSIEQEMASMAKNTLYYQALLTGLGKRGEAIKMAIAEGR